MESSKDIGKLLVDPAISIRTLTPVPIVRKSKMAKAERVKVKRKDPVETTLNAFAWKSGATVGILAVIIAFYSSHNWEKAGPSGHLSMNGKSEVRSRSLSKLAHIFCRKKETFCNL